jgi:hypothetical protein
MFSISIGCKKSKEFFRISNNQNTDLREFFFIFSFKGSDSLKLEKNKFIFHGFKILFGIKCFIKKR